MGIEQIDVRRASFVVRCAWFVVPCAWFVALASLLLGVPACGGGGSTSTPTQPSPAPAPAAPPVNVAGTWRGTASDSSGPGQVSLQITQTDATLTGSMTMTDTSTAVTGRGTLSGTVSGSAIHLSLTIPAGGFDVPYAACSASVSGDGQVSGSTITAAYTGTNSCSGAISAGQVTVNKQ